MSESNGTAGLVDNFRVDLQLLDTGQPLRGEGLVDVVDVNVRLLQSCPLERARDGGHGADAHDGRVHS